ncbi:MAG TPA: adenylate/guanylate cyclase domain-containing protein [Anaerolineae bacterium]|nr:adenylate/guanylate cyclase domain-containing protein [Anaerolineae bacterium]
MRHISQEFTEKLEAVRASRSMQGERRIVTALFCDVAGSTAMAENLDPEEWAEIMNQAFDYLIAPVYRYEGVVARLMGDAILAFFGAPIAHEDDPVRAVLAGLDIVRSVRPFREHIRREYGLDFKLRVGINTGPVVVGEVGSDLQMEYTAMGDAVNLAARMEQTALPGTVQITQHTYRLVAPFFDVYEVGSVEAKGRHEPVQAYRVLGWHEQPGLRQGVVGLRAPLVGREQEFETLKRIVDEVRDGRGQIVCLIGEAGLGKSRLIEELHAYWKQASGAAAADLPGQTGVRPVWGVHQGMSYDATRAYGVFRHYLRRTFEIEEDDPPDAVRRKVARIARGRPPEEVARVTHAVEVMLAVAAEPEEPLQSGEALKRNLFEAALAGWRDVATRAPSVAVLDDLHWADQASVELLQHLFQLTEEVPILFLCAMRPYRQSPGWQVKLMAERAYAHRYAEIELHPLSAVDSELLIDNLLDAPDLPDHLRQLLLRKAEGNPFFVEEVARALIDSGAIVRDEPGTPWRAGPHVDAAHIDIPDSVQALLTARIDRLEDDVRRTLQLASVIGRTFSYRVLERVVAQERPHALDQHLKTLQRADLIRLAAHTTEPVYAFRHELTRDAAYASILRRHRRAFHRRAGEAIEALFAERLEEQADRLAYHFDEAADDERVLRYTTLAGDVAARLYATAEAIRHYTRAVEIASRATASSEQLIYLYTSRGRMFEVSGRHKEAAASYRELERLAHERGDRTLELAALIPWATIHSTYTAEFDPEQGQALSERALALARDMQDHRAEAKALWNLMLLTLFAGRDARQAVAYGEQALAIARRHALREELAYILHDIARAYFEAGEVDPAWSAQEEALALWRELGDLPMLADTLASAASRYYWVGELDKAMALAQEARRISESIANSWGEAYSLSVISPIYLERGEVDKGIQALEDAVALGERANYWGAQVFARAILAWVYGLLGDVERGFAAARLALAKTEEFGQPRHAILAVLALLHLYGGNPEEAFATIHQAREEPGPDRSGAYPESTLMFDLIDGEVALAHHDYEHVLQLAERAITAMRAMGVRSLRPNMLYLKGKALHSLGKTVEARQILSEARAEIGALGLNHSLFLLPVLRALSEIEAQAGNALEAQALRKQAREIVEFIADHAGSPERRASFLGTSLARAR